MKEAAGKLSGNDKLRAEGKADQTKGNLKLADINAIEAEAWPTAEVVQTLRTFVKQ
jgi:hypothetical protein